MSLFHPFYPQIQILRCHLFSYFRGSYENHGVFDCILQSLDVLTGFVYFLFFDTDVVVSNLRGEMVPRICN